MILSMKTWRNFSSSLIDLHVIHMQRSSANRVIFTLSGKQLAIELKYMIKIVGDRLLPCGTPQLIGRSSERDPLLNT